MAIIQCPECGKEISDKARACVYCGCPINQNRKTKKQKARMRGIIIGAASVLIVSALCLTLFVFIPKSKERKLNDKYENVISMLEHGQYEDASIILNELKGYKDVDTILEQIVYESYAISCIKEYQQILKSPDSIQVYEINFYKGLDPESKHKYPMCIIHSGAQNGFGGTTEGYAIFSNNDETGYSFIGSCKSLDKDDYNLEDGDDDDFMDALTALIIKAYYDKGVEVGSINIDRIKTLLKNQAYTAVTIIN